MTVTRENRLGRTVGLWGATGIGVGAIVGGGILALAGVAFVATGPGAIAAFALNGVIAALTALSFAELASTFPESGGSYTFAKKTLSGEAAFMVGWVVWLASIVAAVLYALGFASYAAFAIVHLWRAAGDSAPVWIESRGGLLALATLATGTYALFLYRKAASGKMWATIGKVIVFIVLIAAGLWALGDEPWSGVAARLTPFFPNGSMGLLQAMGYTFIALQGFDLIAAVGGEVKDPQRNIPRAMFLSLGAALAIYLPFLFVVATVGVEAGDSITARSAENPATVVASAARIYMGSFGFWLVIVAAVLSMLSALHANLLAASRVALTMARDRSLPHALGDLHRGKGTPAIAILVTALMVVTILVLVPNVPAAGAVSSLIFLVSFALAHGLNILTRVRGGGSEAAFRVPAFPLVPIVGGLACVGLAIYQAFVVPAAGLIALLWLGFGIGLYFFRFAHRAGVVDASAEGLDPQLVRSRGRTPLVLVPIAKPASTAAMVELANAITPPIVGRVLLHSVVLPPGMWERGDLAQQLVDVEAILNQSLFLSITSGSTPEWLTTVAPDPWLEIARVARIHRCESLLVGLGELSRETMSTRLEVLINAVKSNVVILRAPDGWKPASAHKILVPVGGRRDQSVLRARLLANLSRKRHRQITYLRVLPKNASERDYRVAERALAVLAQDESSGAAEVLLVRSGNALGELVQASAKADLIVLGLQRLADRRRTFGEITIRLASETSSPLILISRR
jgi:APA family basic amino acid/polyamine antiporter